MGRNLSPALRRELANLDKDADSRKSAMKALKTYVKDLDSNAIPLFLEQVSETKETGSLSGEYTISLYEVLARVHGVNIVPQIDSIMATIVKTLASSAGSFPLQQACSRVVPAIARYGIDPTTPENKKRHIIYSLCKPLAESLLGSQESLTSGAALCLKALVDADNWRYASDDMVNKVCQNVAVSLEEKSTQTNSHMGLVMALAKRNSLIVEAYARLLVRSAMKILQAGLSEANSQKRLSAIQMVNFLMKWLDPRGIFSELPLIIEEMEKCQSDQMAFVRGAAFETLQTARRIATERGCKFEKRSSSETQSIGRRDENQGRNLWSSGEASSASTPESRMLDFNFEYDSLLESPLYSQVSSDLTYDRQSVHRKLWRHENGGVDISLKDGLFSELSNGTGLSSRSVERTPTRQQEYNAYEGDDANDFIGFQPRSPRYEVAQQTPTPSPQRPRSPINVDNIKIFTTPRKLVHSLQDLSDGESDMTRKSLGRFRSPCSSVDEWSPVRNFEQDGLTDDPHDAKEENYHDSAKQFHGASESLSSADNIVAHLEKPVPNTVTLPDETKTPTCSTRKAGRRTAFRLICSVLFVLLVIFCSLHHIDDREYRHLVPT